MLGFGLDLPESWLRRSGSATCQKSMKAGKECVRLCQKVSVKECAGLCQKARC
jgi:hypothetical protein